MATTERTSPQSRAPRQPPPLLTLEVVRRARLTPHLIRVVFGGPGIAGYRHNEFTDRYVKLVFGVPGVAYPEPLDLAAVRRDLPPEQWPKLRTYTIRAYDAAAGELTIDFVHHGDEGLAGPWAASAAPGDRLHLLGPGGAYAPSADADWHLLVGDEAVLPAIAAALEAIPEAGHVYAVLEVADEAEVAYLHVPDGAVVRWLLRDRQDPSLVEAVRAMTFPEGRVHAFVHGELAAVRELRAHLVDDRGIPVDHLSISGYWRRGKDEDGFQAEKADDARRAEAPAG